MSCKLSASRHWLKTWYENSLKWWREEANIRDLNTYQTNPMTVWKCQIIFGCPKNILTWLFSGLVAGHQSSGVVYWSIIIIIIMLSASSHFDDGNTEIKHLCGADCWLMYWCTIWQRDLRHWDTLQQRRDRCLHTALWESMRWIETKFMFWGRFYPILQCHSVRLSSVKGWKKGNFRRFSDVFNFSP